MIYYTAPIDLAEKPLPISVNDDRITLSKNLGQADNTGLWVAQQMSKEWPDHPSEEEILASFNSIWNDWNDQYIAQQQEEVDSTDILLTDMYEQLISVQESQEATDAVLCDLYEALGGGQ